MDVRTVSHVSLWMGNASATGLPRVVTASSLWKDGGWVFARPNE